MTSIRFQTQGPDCGFDLTDGFGFVLNALKISYLSHFSIICKATRVL